MTRRRMPLAIALTFLSALAMGGLQYRGGAARLDGTLSDRLHLSFQPYVGKGHENMPVEVLKFDVVVGETSMWVREWQLKNRSGKDIVKLRPSLFVYSGREPDTLLIRHQILAYYGVGLRAGEEWPQGPCASTAKSCSNSFAMLGARELLTPLAKSGEPEGEFRIALGIDKVWFADGEFWEFDTAKGE